MDRATISSFQNTLFQVINCKSAHAYDYDCSVDIFSNEEGTSYGRRGNFSNQKVDYAVEGLRYAESFLPKEIFTLSTNILVARKGKPYKIPVADLFQSEDIENEDPNSIPTTPQSQRPHGKNSIRSRPGHPKQSVDSVLGISRDNNQNETNELDGSPLKLVYYADLSVCDSSYSSLPATSDTKKLIVNIPDGFTFQRSRQLTSLFCVNYSDLMSKSTDFFSNITSFWCLCNGKDRLGTILTGAIPVLYSSEKTCHWGLKLTTLTQVETDDVRSIEEDIFREKVDTNKCFARYDIVPSTVYQGNAALEFTWNKATKLLQKPELYSEAVIKTSVNAGDDRSPVIALYKELSILKSFMTSITSGEMKWSSFYDDTPPLLDQVKELIAHIKLGDVEHQYQDKIQSEEDSEQSSIHVGDLNKLDERLDYDFTDYLWKIVITCSSYSELVTSLNYIFRALSKGEFQPAVHKKNKTTMARLVQDSYTGRLDMPHMGGTFPLKLVVEMGIEKLRCDYAHAFISHDLTTLLDLEQFLRTDLQLLEKISNLEKMHHTLEIISMIHLFGGLSYTFLSGCAQKMLKYYETNPVNNKEFEFPVPAKPELLSAIKHHVPSMWSLTLEKKVGATDLSELMVWTLTTSQPFVHLEKEENDQLEKSEDSAKYFCTCRKDNISILG